MENNNIPFINLKHSIESCYEESVDAIVSDLYPDIREVLGIEAKAYIKDVAVQNDRVLITGEIKCEICFEGETTDDEQNILKMKVNLNFARVEEIDAKDCVVFANCKLQTINAKIINPRKISVIADMMLKTDAYENDEIITNKTTDLSYETQKTKKNVELITSVNRNDFTLSDSVIFQVQTKMDYELFGVLPSVTLSDVKIMKNKLMLRGNVEFSGGFTCEDNIGTISASVPFSQICDITIEDENMRNTLDIVISDFELENTQENEYYFKIQAKCLFLQYQKFEIECINDLYSTTHDLEIIKETVGVNSFGVCEVTHNTHNIELESNVEQIVFANCNMYKTKNEQGNFEINASINAIYKENNRFKMLKKSVCLFKNTPECQIINEKIEVSNQLKLAYDLIMDNKSIVMYDKYQDIIEKSSKDTEKDCIILKHISKNTLIWEIAKEYNSTEEAIKLANDIETEAIKDKMIIIPR